MKMMVQLIQPSQHVDLATNIDGAYHVYAEDMDADGDIDILASASIGR